MVRFLRILVVFVAYVALFQPILYRFGVNLSFLDYVDEALSIVAWGFVLIHYHRLEKNERRITFLLFLILVVGLLGTLKYQIQTRTFPVILDYFSYCKVFIVYIWARHVIGELPDRTKERISRHICRVMPLFIVIAFVGAIISVFVDIGWSQDVRFEHRCYAFLYPKSSTLANTFYVIIFLLVLRYKDNIKRKNSNLFLILCAVVVWILTLRSRALFFAFLFAFLFYWIVLKEKNFKIRISSIVLVLFFGLFVTGDRIEQTFSNEDRPRTILLVYGVRTMFDCLPIGAGFGTYGTDVACTYYSPLYLKYGFQYAYGLNPDDTQYARDCYWPAIMGEFGILGVLITVAILFYLCLLALRDSRNNRIAYMITLFLLLTQILASLPTSVFFQGRTVFLFLLIPLLRNTNQETNMKKFEWT